MRKVVILGGGFGGIAAAQTLAKLNKDSAADKIILLSNKSHFEYTASLYRVITGRSPMEVCVPLRELFPNEKQVQVEIDTITEINLAEKKLVGKSGSHYNYDHLVLALGSETAYFNIPGLEQYSFGFKSIPEALELKNHLHKVIEQGKTAVKDEKTTLGNIVIVGAGPTGTEIAGELSVYLRQLTKKHGLDPSLVTIELIEAAPRILPSLPEELANNVAARLRSLGVNIFTNRTVTSEEIDRVHLKDMEMKTKTLIWTAGVKPNRLLATTKDLPLNEKGKIIVDDHLRLANFLEVQVIGDIAAVQYSGMAQTAIDHGKYVAQFINNPKTGTHKPKKPAYAVPVGPGWGAVLVGPFHFYGYLGWLIRRAADLRFFSSILPLNRALAAFSAHRTLCETCEVCLPEQKG